MYSLMVLTRQGWTTIGDFTTKLALYAKYRYIRATTELLGAKVMLDGKFDHIIF